jgi:hypothetical protein
MRKELQRTYLRKTIFRQALLVLSKVNYRNPFKALASLPIRNSLFTSLM